MGAVVDHVPHHEGLLRELLIVEHARDALWQLELGDVGDLANDATVASRLAVLEDHAPRELGDLAHRDRLGEEHCRIRVVAGREVDEPQRHEQFVAVVARLELLDELGPNHLGEQRLDVAVARSVLGVHGEHDEMAQAVDPVLLRLEGLQRVEEVWDAEPLVRPTLEVDHGRGEVFGVVRKGRCERADAGNDLGHERAGLVVGVARRRLGVSGDGSVLHLERLDARGRRLEAQPGIAGLGQTSVLDNLGFADERRAWSVRGWTSEPPITTRVWVLGFYGNNSDSSSPGQEIFRNRLTAAGRVRV